MPACVSTCPAGARHYGDLGDPNSAVSQLVVERLGYDLMPELGYKPTNKYLPPREAASHHATLPEEKGEPKGVLKWLDKVLSI